MTEREFPIVAKLGGREAVVEKLRATGWTGSYDTVRMWTSRGRIPGGPTVTLIELAENEGLAVSGSDFKLACLSSEQAA